MKSKKPTVIFVAGTGRSGSTLLDRTIGSAANAISIGEVRQIWRRVFLENGSCGCGLRFNDCTFWSEVLRELSRNNDLPNPQELVELHRLVERLRYVPMLLSPSLRTKAFSNRLDRYRTLLADLYLAIAKVSGAEFIVDSSKTPGHGLIISGIGGIRIWILHLVRDSRAVAYSWQRRKKLGDPHSSQRHLPRFGIVHSSITWTLWNWIYELMRNRCQESELSWRVRYEDFVSRPRETVAQILEPMNISKDQINWIGDRSVELAVSHTVLGNPIRFRIGPMPLRVDDEWLTKMPWYKKAIVDGLTFFGLKRYKYL